MKLTSEQVNDHVYQFVISATPDAIDDLRVILRRAEDLRGILTREVPDGATVWVEVDASEGLCGHLTTPGNYSLVSNLLGLVALQFDWCDHSTSWMDVSTFTTASYLPLFPIGGYREYHSCNKWEGESLRRRLELLNAVIETLGLCLSR